MDAELLESHNVPGPIEIVPLEFGRLSALSADTPWSLSAVTCVAPPYENHLQMSVFPLYLQLARPLLCYGSKDR